MQMPPIFRHAGRAGLTTRLSIAMAVAMLIGAAVLLVTSAVQEKSHFSRELEEYLNDEMNTLLITLSEQVVIGDYATIEKVLNDHIKKTNVDSITFVDNSGGKIAATERPDVSHAPKLFDLLVNMPVYAKTEAIVIGGRSYGKITLNLTTMPITNYMWSALVKDAQALLLALVLVLAVMTAIVRSSLKPLNALAAGAHRIGSGDYTARIPEEGTTEMVLTVSAFNRMAEQLCQTLDQLKQSRDRYSLLYNETPVLLHSIDRNAVIVEVNDYWLKTLGYRRDEVIGRKVVDFYSEDSRTFAQNVVHPEFFRHGLVKDIPYQFIKKSGEVTDVLLSATAERDAAGNILRSMAVIVDVTERIRAEERLRLATRAANIGIWDWDIPKNELVWDESMYRLYGIKREDFAGAYDAWARTIHRDDKARTEADIQKALRGESEYAPEFRIIWPDGTIRHMKADSRTFRSKDGKPLRMVGTNIDITERKRSEEATGKLEEQLRQSQKMESIGTLAGGIAHDFNNILTAIIGYGNIALMDMAKDDPQRLNIEQMLDAGNRAAHLTKDLLLFSRKQISERKPLDLNNIIRKVETFLKRVIGEDVECRTKLRNGALPILGDAHQLEQVLMNLATNARDAMPSGGNFSITTDRVMLDAEFITTHGYGKPGNYAVATISDTGIGMDEITRKHIFEPFFTTKEVGRGTGLGLAVVYGIIKQHDGFINVYSEPGGGTTFNIYLSLIAAQADDKIVAEEERIKGGTETILLAEDDEVVRSMIRRVLTDFGYQVITAIDGQDAVIKYGQNKEKIQLLLFDLVMPKKNGIEAYAEIKVTNPRIKVMFQSGYAADLISQKALLDDTATVIQKPISPMALLRTIREKLDSH